jgi:uncharacterized protein
VSSATSPATLPQLVPSSACFRCDVCCRFPEAESFLRPYFTHQEIARAVASGVHPRAFPHSTGAQINLVRHPTGEGYLCPAFDAATNRCGIYDIRPLDCQLYPLALMWDAAHEQVVLGWDQKCPFMLDALPPAIAAHAERVTALLEQEETLESIGAHPRLIGRFQEDVVVLKALPRVTARLSPRPIDTRLQRLTAAEAPRFREALARARLPAPDALAAYAVPYHYMWTSTLSYWWMESEETFFLFAQSPDGLFMPLVPLGARPLARTVTTAFAWMHQWNRGSPVSRIEHVMTRQKHELEQAGFPCTAGDGDYLYEAPFLAALAGDRYKPQRALCNRVERDQRVVIEPYGPRDRAACGALYARWASQKHHGLLDALGRMLLEDAEAAHDLVCAQCERFGLRGAVARVEGEVAGYTFGYWLTPQTWCVLLEVADRTIPGLAQFLFRETCRAAADHGAGYVNAMDDAGLAGLRQAKLAYRPTMVIENWAVREPRT